MVNSNKYIVSFYCWLFNNDFLIERELVQELDAYKSGKRASTSNKSLTAKLDSHIKNIENERDFFKQEVDTLQKLLKSAQHDCQVRSSSANRTSSTRNNFQLFNFYILFIYIYI